MPHFLIAYEELTYEPIDENSVFISLSPLNGNIEREPILQQKSLWGGHLISKS